MKVHSFAIVFLHVVRKISLLFSLASKIIILTFALVHACMKFKHYFCRASVFL